MYELTGFFVSPPYVIINIINHGDRLMIVSVSRRTDIPAFYSDWFIDKIEQGFLYVMNPFNRKQISKIILTPDTVDCFVFWTKDAAPMMDKLHILNEMGFKYYFQFTLTPYDKDIEPEIRSKDELLNTFVQLSRLVGSKKVVWRYDPILLSNKYNKEYHNRVFEKFCKKLCGSTEKCVISFIDMYAKTKRNTKGLGILQTDEKDMIEIATMLADIAGGYGICIKTCCEKINLSGSNISNGKCIDDKLVEKILGCSVNVKKDDTQREGCGCVKSIDIGQYNTCGHFCTYCYANYNQERVIESMKNHDIHSPLLVGRLRGDETITVREMKSIKISQNP